MNCCIHFLILITFITENLALESLSPPTPNSNCPLIDDVNHAVMLPYPPDCSKYFSCLKGLAYLQQCPNNLFWSPLTYRCDYSDKAKCEISASFVPTNSINQVSANERPASFTSEILYQLHPQDCSKYLKCQALACPTNFYWNARMEKCDFPHNVQCPFLKSLNDLENTNSLSTLKENPMQIPPYREETFTFQYPNDCNKFYECQTMLCPVNYHWNSRLQQCDLPQDARCSRQPEITEILDASTVVVPTAFTAPTTIATSTQVSENISTECLDCYQSCKGYLHHYLPHPYDCRRFIQCNGWSFIHICPDNLFWNAKLNTCDRVCVNAR